MPTPCTPPPGCPPGADAPGPCSRASPAGGWWPAGRCRWLPSLASELPAGHFLHSAVSGWMGARWLLPLAAQPRQRRELPAAADLHAAELPARRRCSGPLALERRLRVDGGPPAAAAAAQPRQRAARRPLPTQRRQRVDGDPPDAAAGCPALEAPRAARRRRAARRPAACQAPMLRAPCSRASPAGGWWPAGRCRWLPSLTRELPAGRFLHSAASGWTGARRPLPLAAQHRQRRQLHAGHFLHSAASGWTGARRPPPLAAQHRQRRQLPAAQLSAGRRCSGPLSLERRQRVDGGPLHAAACRTASPAARPARRRRAAGRQAARRPPMLRAPFSKSAASGWTGARRPLPLAAQHPQRRELPAAELSAGRRCSGPLSHRASPAGGWWAHRPLPLAAQPRQRTARRPLPTQRRQRVDGGPPDAAAGCPASPALRAARSRAVRRPPMLRAPCSGASPAGGRGPAARSRLPPSIASGSSCTPAASYIAPPAGGRGPAGRCRWLPSIASAASCTPSSCTPATSYTAPPNCPPAADAPSPCL